MLFLLSFFLVFIAPVAVQGECYAPGPAFPPVNRILNNTFLAQQLKPILDKVVLDNLISAVGWNPDNTSFALLVTSSEGTVWEYYHTASILGDYEDGQPTDVSGDTAFRVASISKTFTVYAVLLENEIGLEDPITKYIPELVEGGHIHEAFLEVQWDQITIRSLASQLSGIRREGGLSDLAVDTVQNPDPIANGFPPVDKSALAPCMKNSTDRACTSEEIFRTARNKTKVFNVNERSSYSNVAFSLLGLALERATGKPYDEVLRDSILKPLGMDHTRTTKPRGSAGIIPYGPNDWAQDLGADNPSGGVYTTPNDLAKYLRSILNSQLLPQSVINEWMKPHSWNAGLNSAYGMPWEILRTTKLTSDGRGTDLITKSGSLTGYYSNIILIPEFGLGLVISVAGDSAARPDLRENVVSALVPATEKLIRDEAKSVYASLFTAWGGDQDWSIKIKVPDEGPGLEVTKWVSNGTDFLSFYGRISGMPNDPEKWQALLIPTGVYTEHNKVNNPKGSTEVWRLTAVPKRDPAVASKVFDDFCITDVDAMMYGGLSIEEFTIYKASENSLVGSDGKMVALMVSIAGMRTYLFRDVRPFGAIGPSHEAARKMQNVQSPLNLNNR
ncbi:beta-lactamase/transpeptidase-like protein [Bisporella sp. PMI_857]|nr:beta-lactamase/transpeptidase-like protein [Bisporella sp. PMI_857]